MADQEWHQWRPSEPRAPRPYGTPPPSYNRPPRPYDAPAPAFERPFVQEDTLKEGYLQIERKSFQFRLKENPRGRFLRISEESSGGRSAIIIPSTGLLEFQKILDILVKADESTPSKSPAPVENPGANPPTAS